jgi:hypothetical protein
MIAIWMVALAAWIASRTSLVTAVALIGLFSPLILMVLARIPSNTTAEMIPAAAPASTR